MTTAKKDLYVACHHHQYGASFKLFRSDHQPSEAEVAKHFDFEPEKDEWIDMDLILESDIVELPVKKGKGRKARR